MPSPQEHPWDEAAAEIVDWLTNEASYYAEVLRGGYAAPFAAQVSEANKLDYYRRQVFKQLPDGTPDFTQPNPQGRDMLIKRIGISGYTRVMAAVMPRPGAPVDTAEPSPDLPASPDDDRGLY